ncbi:probable serine/threonine-protein kinase kinX [Anneissia japonica]|uniref:probable serine/threonine-protein kinase kinX n=1 Tax=Anneissia japonica TaxID=1529436 RepID=UPI00142567E4|nr:probable serine/threonine-protein kinase kinX [Anneissia japonica]
MNVSGIRSIKHEELDFESEETIGSIGSSAEVFKACWRTDDKRKIKVAVKIYKKNRQEIEINILQDLDHKNVIKFYGQYDRFPSFGLVMELATQGDLFAYLAAKRHEHTEPASPVRLPESQFAQWCCQAASAVQYLHSKNITHKDIKSMNYLLSDDIENSLNVLKLCDFGLSKQGKNSESLLTSYGGFTKSWAPIEVFRDARVVSQKSDIYSLCVVVWELWTCEQPWAGMQDGDITNNIMNGVLLSIPEDFPKALKPMIDRCWQNERERRCHIDEVLCYLEEFALTLKGNENGNECSDETYMKDLRFNRKTTTQGDFDVLASLKKLLHDFKHEGSEDTQYEHSDGEYEKIEDKSTYSQIGNEAANDYSVPFVQQFLSNTTINLPPKPILKRKTNQDVKENVIHSQDEVVSDSSDDYVVQQFSSNTTINLPPKPILERKTNQDVKENVIHSQDEVVSDSSDDYEEIEVWQKTSEKELATVLDHVKSSAYDLLQVKTNITSNILLNKLLTNGERRHLFTNINDVEQFMSRFDCELKCCEEQRYRIVNLIKRIVSSDDIQPLVNFSVFSKIRMNMLEFIRLRRKKIVDTIECPVDEDEFQMQMTFANFRSILIEQANWLKRFHSNLKNFRIALINEKSEANIVRVVDECCDNLEVVVEQCDLLEDTFLKRNEIHCTAILRNLQFTRIDEEKKRMQESLITEEGWAKTILNILLLENGKRKPYNETSAKMIVFVSTVLIVKENGYCFEVIDVIPKKNIRFQVHPSSLPPWLITSTKCIHSLTKRNTDSKIPSIAYWFCIEDMNDRMESVKLTSLFDLIEEEITAQMMEYSKYKNSKRYTQDVSKRQLQNNST